MTNSFRYIFLVGFLFLIGGVLTAWQSKVGGEYSPYRVLKDKKIEDLSVEEVLVNLGDDKPRHYIQKTDPDSVKMGEDLIKIGQLDYVDGHSRISKYFVCTDCHNLVLETDDPSDESPDRVLKYSKANGIPFLPASTFYSMYNKRHWYNGDYAKKYGDLVADTRDTLENAIQLCATQCSQGREMEDWEIRCVMHFYKSIELQITDLVFSTQELSQLSSWQTKKKDKAIELIKSKYNQINDAHFGTSKIPEIEGYEPSFENGKYIYTDGCLWCHAPGRDITNFDLSMNKLDFKFLQSKKYDYTSYSISHITRYGTYAISGRKQYMPQYTYENMSDEQMLDLMHFIETKANE